MYSEENSQETILNRMLGNVPSEIDKSEGSFIYDALSPASNEMAQVYIIDDNMLKRIYPFTATGTDLENITNTVGVTRKLGGKATTDILINGTSDIVIPSGTLMQTNQGLRYKTLKDVTLVGGQAMVEAEAENVGSNYNVPANTIVELPVQISGITSIANLEAVTNGYDIEDDDSLRGRYFERMQTPATSGNKYQYRNWAKEVPGVGDAKPFPLWNGPGTVKVVIINSNKRAADAELVQKVKDYIDPQPEGHGEGKAPIGATLTVVSAVEKAIDITAKVVLANGYTIQQVQDNFNTNMQKYLSDQAFNSTYISYAKVGGILLSAGGVVDYSNLTLNAGTSNISLNDEEIPVAGTISLEV